MSIEMEVDVPENQKTTQKRNYKTIIDCFRDFEKGQQNILSKNTGKFLKHVSNSSKHNNETEVQYVINRLIRGLGSSIRANYYPILLTLVDTEPEIYIENVVKSIEKELQAAGNSSKSENFDVSLGQILSAGAVLDSKSFMKLSKERQKYFLELILNVRNSHRDLACVAATIIVNFINTIDKDQFFAIVWPIYRSLIKKIWEEQNINDIYLAMAIQTKFPETIITPEMSTAFGKSGILTKSNAPHICNVLFKLADAKAFTHPAYNTIAKIIGQSKLLPTFLTSLDAQLLKFNRNRLFIASIILRNIIPNIKDSEQIPNLLTNNLVRKLVEHYENKKWKSDSELNAELKNTFVALIDSLKKEEISSSVKLNVIKKLILYPGTLTFETMTEIRVVQNLIPTLDLQGIKSLSELFKEVVFDLSQAVDKDAKRAWSNAEKIYALQMLSKLLSHSKVKDDVSFRVEYTKMLMDIGFLKNQKTALISDSARELFSKVLEHKFSKLVDLHNFLAQLNEHFKSIINSKNLTVSFSEEELKTLKKMFKLMTQKKSNDTAVQVFHILFYYMGLQSFKNKELVFNCLNELFLCYERVGGKRASKSKDGDDPEWIEVVVDLFLSLLSLNLNVFRNFIVSIFPSLCEYLTASAIDQILNVMDPTSEVNPLSNTDDEDESEVSENEDESESEAEADGSEAEADGSEKEAEEEKEDEAEADDSEDESDEDNSEFEDSATDLDKLRLAVQQALQNGDQDETDSGDLDLDDMSETEGKRLDKALSEAFKGFRSGKLEEKTNSVRILMTFRLKVLDLIELIVQNEPSMLTCLKIMKSLLNTLEFTIFKEDQKPLQVRIRTLLKKLKAVKKFTNIEEVTMEELGTLFKDITDKGEKSVLAYRLLNQDIAHCCVFIIKCSQILCKCEDVELPTTLTEDNEVIQAMLELTKECLEKKYLYASFVILSKTVCTTWNGNLFVIKLLLNSFHKVKLLKQRLILDVLKDFYRNRRIQYADEQFKLHLEKAENKFVMELKKSIALFCTDQTTESNLIKHDIAVKLFHLFKCMHLHPLKNRTINWEGLVESLKEYALVTSNHVIKLCNELCLIFNVAIITKEYQKRPMKAKSSELEVSTNGNFAETVDEVVDDSENENEIEENVEESEEELEESKEKVADIKIKKTKKKGSKQQNKSTKENNDVSMKEANTSSTENKKKISKKLKMKKENSFNLSSTGGDIKTKSVQKAGANMKRKRGVQNKNSKAKKQKMQ